MPGPQREAADPGWRVRSLPAGASAESAAAARMPRKFTFCLASQVFLRTVQLKHLGCSAREALRLGSGSRTSLSRVCAELGSDALFWKGLPRCSQGMYASFNIPSRKS